MESQIKNYLESIVKMLGDSPQARYYKLILKHGALFTASDVIKMESTYFEVKQRQCYRNAILHTLYSEDIDYLQGYCLTDGIHLSLEHAFNLKGGKIVDTTAEVFNIPVLEYFGVLIPRDFVLEYAYDDQCRDLDLILPEYLNTLENEN